MRDEIRKKKIKDFVKDKLGLGQDDDDDDTESPPDEISSSDIPGPIPDEIPGPDIPSDVIPVEIPGPDIPIDIPDIPEVGVLDAIGEFIGIFLQAGQRAEQASSKQKKSKITPSLTKED